MQKIKDYLDSIATVSETDWEFLLSKMEICNFPKKTILLKTGQVENYLYFIEEGIVRYYLPKDENDLTFGFSFENEFASAYDSFLTQTPCSYQIETLTSTKIWRITHSGLSDIYKETEAGTDIGRIMGEGLFIKSIKRELSLLNQSAEQRYLKLFTERPELLQLIPLKHVASYIGITPQALSRIRKRIS